MKRSSFSLALVASALLAACAATNDPAGESSGSGAASSGGSGGAGGSLVGGIGGLEQPEAVAHLTGKVLAPEGTIPISGALLYLTSTPPPNIPGQTYCDECVALDASTAHTFSAADGTFTLPAYELGEQTLVVQKGQFRRVRSVNVAEGTQAIPAEPTTLPGASNPAGGDTIPKMAVVVGAWDSIEDSLTKLGMQPGSVELASASLLGDVAQMKQHHIVFVPCSFSDGVDCNTSPIVDPTVQNAVRDFVGTGGKLYVTDYSYDFVRQVWPDHVDWVGQTASFGSACMTGSYDAPAQVEDADMQAWLAAQGLTSFELEANWTMIDKVNTVPTTDADGNPIMLTPKVWVSAQTPSSGVRPATISFESGCGRVLFSTYHTEGNAGGSLLAQEKALLYVLLEVSVCVETPVAN